MRNDRTGRPQYISTSLSVSFTQIIPNRNPLITVTCWEKLEFGLFVSLLTRILVYSILKSQSDNECRLSSDFKKIPGYYFLDL